MISVDELRRLRELEMERDTRLLEDAVRGSGGTVGIQELVTEWRQAYPGAESAPATPSSRKRSSRKAERKARR